MAEKKRKRIPRYISEDGMYLVVEEQGDYYRLAWCSDDFGTGMFIGDHDDELTRSQGTPDWEQEKVYSIAKTFADGQDRRYGFQFVRHANATKVLREINEALHNREDKPLPEWAIIAKSQGWVPPVGWKP